MTIVSRLQLDHPALGTAGGSGLHTSIENLYKKIGDNMTSRFFYIEDLNNAANVDVEHNYNVDIASLRYDLYLWDTGTQDLTLITATSSPAISSFTIAATPSFTDTKIRVTNNSGAQRDLVLVVLQDPIEISELTDVTISSAADGEVLTYETSTSQWKNKPAAQSSGSVNYISDSAKPWNFETASITGWNTYKDAAAATPADGTGGSPTVITISRNTTTPLRGVADLKISKAASNGQGEGVSIDVTVPSGYQYGYKGEITLLVNTNTANYTAGDFAIYVYDITNSTLITPSVTAIPKIKNQWSISWDSSATGSQYRLIFHCTTTSTSAYDIYIDDIIFGPGKVIPGFPSWDNQSITVSGSWVSNTTYTAKETRRGSWATYRVKVATSGAPTSTALSINMPSGRTIDSSALLSPASVTQLIGIGTACDLSTATWDVAVMYESTT